MTGLLSLHHFDNIGQTARRRSYPGFARKSDRVTERLSPRQCRRFDLQSDDLVTLSGQPVLLAVFDGHGRLAPEVLGTSANATLPTDHFDTAALAGWMAANGGLLTNTLTVIRIEAAEPVILRASAPCTVWAILPVSAADLVTAGSPGLVEVSVKPGNAGNATPLPPELGAVRDEFTVRRGTAMAYELEPGEFVQVIDLEGQQCSDFMAFRTDGLDLGREWMIDNTATRSMVRRAYPGPGLHDKFFDQDMRPMLRVVQDTCGRHDTYGLACTARGYEDRGFPGHLNCSDNISAVTGPYGVAPRSAWPAINFFWNTWIDPHDPTIMTEESHSRPGDHVVMQAMDRLLCVSTACPDDIDPINGWNPTDIHVRIYRQDAPIIRAVAYREKENTPMSISQESAFHDRTSALTNAFAPARNLWAPVSYQGDGTLGEYWACREAVTMQDMSSLRKYDIIGPDAERLLQQAMTRDVSKLAVWRGTYALLCDEAGSVIDDGTLFRLADHLFRWCCGHEESAETLTALARQMDLDVRIHAHGDALPNLALQGPKSRDVLRDVVYTAPHVPALEHVKWFGVTVARLHDRDGAPFMLARSGYTGELGYEIFCARANAVEIWDALMAAGEQHGITPMGSAALETIRIEAGLAASGHEFAPGIDAYESGLGFAVDMRKAAFTGRAALERNATAPRRVLTGLLFDCDDVPAHGAPVLAGAREVGQVTSATRSPSLQRSIAMARLAVEYADTGTELTVGMMDGRMKRLSTTVCDIPFIDPKRTRARA